MHTDELIAPTGDDTHRPLPRPVVGRAALHPVSATALDHPVPLPPGARRGAPRSLGRHGATVAVGAVVLAALGLIVALVVSVGRAGTGSATSGQPVVGLTVPTNYVPATTDPRDNAVVAAAPTRPQTPTRVPVPAAGTPAVRGGWTPAIGARIANRALQWLNTPYSWAAGNADGPTFGMAVDHDSRNDASVRGFDCSGLVIYALAPWLAVDHSAAAQYVEAGSVHPSFAQLQPGDLIFWSSDGSVKGVGHVAIYVGNGNVVQAPQSGDVVRITPVDQVEAGTIGTTRPLTD